MFLIRNFGNDKTCPSLAALTSALTGYAGKSIAIEDQRPGGRSYFVDVTPSGLYESYGSRARFDIECRLDNPGGN